MIAYYFGKWNCHELRRAKAMGQIDVGLRLYSAGARCVARARPADFRENTQART